MAGGKTTQRGMGHAKPNRATRLGHKVEKKKIITKRGMVAPSPEDPARLEEFIPASDRQAPASEIVEKNAQLDASSSEAAGVYHKTTDPKGLTPPPPLDQMQLEATGHPEETGYSDAQLEAVESTRELETDPLGMDPFDEEEARALLAERIAAHEDVTPREGTDIEDPDVRARFRTAPGGGLNRMSGGREHARAYVSPVTVKPGTSTTPVTGAVKVLDVVNKAVRAYRTEPSLLRRRQSSLPPTPPPLESRMHLLVGAIAIGLVIGAMLVWAVIRTTGAPTPDPGQATDISPPPASPAPPKKQKNSRNEPAPRPKTEAEGPSKAPPAEAPKGLQAKPSVRQEATAAPSTSISQPVPAEESVANRPRFDAKPAVDKPLPAEAEKPPSEEGEAPKATKPSSQDLWLE